MHEVEKFYITYGYNEAYPINDESDKKIHRMTYNDCIEFADAYYQVMSKNLVDKLNTELRQAEAKGYNLGLSHGQQQ